MKITAYDLDGVLTPDVLFDKERLDYINDFRTNFIVPMFKPEGHWGILTARPVEDKDYVYQWVLNSFKENPPDFLIQDNNFNMSPAGYKRYRLNDLPDVSMFVESDPQQAANLNETVRKSCKIILFSDLILEAIRANKI